MTAIEAVRAWAAQAGVRAAAEAATNSDGDPIGMQLVLKAREVDALERIADVLEYGEDGYLRRTAPQPQPSPPYSDRDDPDDVMPTHHLWD